MDKVLLDLIQTALQGVVNVGDLLTDRLLPTGLAIFAALTFALTILMFVQLMAENVSIEEIAPRLVRHILNVCFVGLLLISYTGGILGVRQVFVGGSEYLVQQVTGKSSDTAFNLGVAQLNDALKRLDSAKVSGGSIDLNAGLWDQAKQALKSGLAVMTSFVAAVIGILVALALAFVLMIYISVYMFGIVMLYLGIIMGPFMIPWKLFEDSSHMFNGWLRFTTAAALYKVVCATVLMMLSGVINSLVTAIESMNASGNSAAGFDIMYACAVLIICMFMSYIMWQVPSIANGLVSGNAGGRADWFKIGRIIR